LPFESEDEAETSLRFIYISIQSLAKHQIDLAQLTSYSKEFTPFFT
jgi:hypothetical protein